MPDNRPVIIVGAPRSGTSLMQKLIREAPGFVSVPKESDMIWLPHCHPATNDWQYEGCPESRITNELIDRIRHDFSTQALSATTWRAFDRLGLMERPRLARCLRLVYRMAFKPWKRLRQTNRQGIAKPGRLVDKSVHAGLWLNLVDAVFPNALYIHMVRSPITCVPSMMHGWNDPDRFHTYRVPETMVSDRKSTTGWWCFPMPAGWRNYYDNDLVEICAFQWNAINESIQRCLASKAFYNRSVRIHLENLATNPHRTLNDLAAHIEVPAADLYNGKSSLPTVNPSVGFISIDNHTLARIEQLTDTVNRSVQL